MSDRSSQLNMTHSFATDTGKSNFDPTLFADYPLEFHPLVFPAKALIILVRPEYPCAKQTVALRLEGPVIDCFRFLDLTKGPRVNFLGTGHGYSNVIKSLCAGLIAKQVHNLLIHFFLLQFPMSVTCNKLCQILTGLESGSNQSQSTRLGLFRSVF